MSAKQWQSWVPMQPTPQFTCTKEDSFRTVVSSRRRNSAWYLRKAGNQSTSVLFLGDARAALVALSKGRSLVLTLFRAFEKLQLFSRLVISWYVRYTLLLISGSSKFLASFSSCHSEESRVACRLPRQAPPGGANVSIGIQLLVFFSAYHHFFQLREVPHVVDNERLGSRCTREVCLGIAVGPSTSHGLSRFSFAAVGCKRTRAGHHFGVRPVFDGGGCLDALSMCSSLRSLTGVSSLAV